MVSRSDGSFAPLLSRVVPAYARADADKVLPRWPFAAMFVPFPIWWALGIAEAAWIPLALIMAGYLAARGRVQVPRGFALWLFFLVMVALSVISIDSGGRLIGFTYRAMLYLTVTIVFVYVYNARRSLTTKYVLGVLVLFWLAVVAGGYLGIVAPDFSFRTPLSYVLPAGLQANELVGEMVVRRATQHNPESYLQIEPRPAAPFLYTNGWGNVYSLLMPVVIAYLIQVRGTMRHRLVLLAIVASLPPAILTLNRGMFLGLAVALAYAVFRLALMGRMRALIALSGVMGVGIVAAVALDVTGRLNDRLEQSSTTEDRANLYSETITRTLSSPLFGYGAPRPSETPGAPSAGTQGHVWMVLFSHGFPAIFLFLAALIYFVVVTARTRSTTELALHTMQLVILVEVFYYGVLPNGLILSFTAAALLMRPPEPPPSPPSLSAQPAASAQRPALSKEY